MMKIPIPSPKNKRLPLIINHKKCPSKEESKIEKIRQKPKLPILNYKIIYIKEMYKMIIKFKK